MSDLKEEMPKILGYIGKWSFIAGMTIAVLSGLYSAYTGNPLNNFVTSILILIGLIIGLINITPKETLKFLFSVLSIFLLRALGGDFLDTVNIFGPYIYGLINTMMILFIPAMVIVALKQIWDFAVDV